MAKSIHPLTASVLGLGLGLTGAVPAMAHHSGTAGLFEPAGTNRVVAQDLPVIVDDVEHGVAGVPGLAGALLGPHGLLAGGGLLGFLVDLDRWRDADMVGGGDVGEDSHVGRGVLGGDEGLASPGGLGQLLHIGSLNSLLGGRL